MAAQTTQDGVQIKPVEVVGIVFFEKLPIHELYMEHVVVVKYTAMNI